MTNPDVETILIIGLSGAGLKTFNLLLDKLYPTCGSSGINRTIRIIVIEKSKMAYWPPGSLRAAVSPDFEKNIIGSFENVIPKRIKNDPEKSKNVMVITGVEVTKLDLEKKVAFLDQSLESFGLDGSELGFKFLVIATGSIYQFPCRISPTAQSPQEVETELKSLQTQIESSKSILIAGGGVVGLEFAGEVSYRFSSTSNRKKITIVSSSPNILSDHSKYLANSIKSQLLDRHVEIIYDYKVDLKAADITKTSKLDSLTTLNLVSNQDGSTKTIEADFVFLAIGNKPNSSIIPGQYLNPETKRVAVNSYLQVVSNESSEALNGVYAVGDVSDFEESKLYAALDGQAGVVSKNMMIDITEPSGEKSQKVIHKPIHGTISIPLGAYGGASEIFGFAIGLGPLATSLAKGRNLFLWMFRSMYPDKPK
ncbi:uncharacterized protein MELLADRAFT_76099 [Melampsora larici-populina 98AG31]|uniref:FAD/NAD(P)-binding domain-containing protein n=1 Tax=Melampsora larici-populina (strain 98AG31 / pathotype 3-4-7) TaxID=747676 RepID=F4SAJ3_MELLP|nr:uncharacterized protein MELLADRAFT_76099 [Melampsora larici-populina 98AG31]EGF98345.1 hypothetical protein MELLADRAFT_76099 [Melampsora larici-populina 98AG31]